MNPDFTLNIPGLEADHAQLSQLINQGVRIVEDLKPVFQRMFMATENSGVDTWDRLRTDWTAHYNEMMFELRGIGRASGGAQDEFLNGDNRAAGCFGR